MTQIPISEPSIKSLFLQMRFNGTDLASGTGFVVKSGSRAFLITNWHNVTGRHPETNKPLHNQGGLPNEIVITHNHVNGLGFWTDRIEPLLDDDEPRWIEHPKLGKKVDFVALPLTQLAYVKLYPYDLVNTGPAIMYGPTDIVSVVGFPFGLRGGGSLALWATGFVASEPTIDYADLPLFLIDCRGREGQSGSPVIAYRSGGMVAMENGNTMGGGGPSIRFLGIYSGRINKESDLGLVWKASAIRELVDSIK